MPASPAAIVMSRSTCRSRWLPVTAILLLGTTFAVAAADAAAPSWLAGFARARITPAEPIMLGGYAAREQPFRLVDEDIFVKALALQDEQGGRSVLLTLDLVGFRGEFAAPTA
jgi:hypothetical protein